MTLSELKALAHRIRRGERRPDVLDLCDGVIVLKEVMPNSGSTTEAQRLDKTKPPSAPALTGACPVCEVNRKLNALRQKKWRDKVRA